MKKIHPKTARRQKWVKPKTAVHIKDRGKGAISEVSLPATRTIPINPGQLGETVFGGLQERWKKDLNMKPVKHLEPPKESEKVSLLEIKRIKAVKVLKANRGLRIFRGMLAQKYPLTEKQCDFVLSIKEKFSRKKEKEK